MLRNGRRDYCTPQQTLNRNARGREPITYLKDWVETGFFSENVKLERSQIQHNRERNRQNSKM